MFGLLMCVTLACTLSAEEVLTVSARLEAEVLDLGGEYEIQLDITTKDGYSTSTAGIPGVILQIDVPPSVRLSGQVLKSYKDLRQNEFLQEPFERLIEETPARIGFKLVKRPATDEVIGLNVLAYVGLRSGEDAWFVRQRLALPLSANAEARVVSDPVSQWGQKKVLQIGDKAAAFSLPRADGSKVSLDQYVGEKTVIVTTYRAHW